MLKHKQPLVSIITPCYNCEKFILETMKSVVSQKYKNYEMIIVDDCSTDNSVSIVKEYAKKHSNIKLIELEKNSGASVCRNIALKEAKGKYVAFLDGDDQWAPEKLNKQIQFMENNGVLFSYSDYEYIDENGNNLHIKRVSPRKVSYYSMILGNSIGCLTTVYNAEKIGLIQISELKKRNDYAIWCMALKKCRKGYKCDGILGRYRKTSSSLSSGGKKKLLKYHYKLHRNINKFGVLCSLFFTFTNVINYIINKKIREKTIKK